MNKKQLSFLCHFDISDEDFNYLMNNEEECEEFLEFVGDSIVDQRNKECGLI